jgi:hypothetical protein
MSRSHLMQCSLHFNQLFSGVEWVMKFLFMQPSPFSISTFFIRQSALLLDADYVISTL